MTLEQARKTTPARLARSLALALSWGLTGCGGPAADSGDAVVVPAAGESAPPATLEPIPRAPSATTSSSAEARPAPAAAASTAEGWGTFKGRVVFGGSPPEVPVLEEKGKAEKDPNYCAKDAPIRSERLLVNGDDKGVKNVLIYFPKPTRVSDDARKAKGDTDVVFDQIKCVFEPHVLAMMVGSKVTLKSSDEVNHNVNAKLQKNSPFNSLIAPGGTALFSPTDAERGPVPVSCDIHPWMQAWWMVLDSPYFATTDAKGNFEIKDVPAGTQKVVVWQEATGFVTPNVGEVVTIKAGDATTKDWTIDPAKVKPAK